jgi:hypothetical protein
MLTCSPSRSVIVSLVGAATECQSLHHMEDMVGKQGVAALFEQPLSFLDNCALYVSYCIIV